MSGGRKYVTVDGKLVAEGHPDARFLASNSEGEVDDEFVARVKEAAVVTKAEEETVEALVAKSVKAADDGGLTVAKAAAKPTDKAVKKSANK